MSTTSRVAGARSVQSCLKSSPGGTADKVCPPMVEVPVLRALMVSMPGTDRSESICTWKVKVVLASAASGTGRVGVARMYAAEAGPSKSSASSSMVKEL
ncbi:MAG: hypothetical protein ACD_39C01909G0001 [uncultured bacterium]|nr:MAG: hypothetical protein ACD_39C01909G0001 [uncultured bacterium]